MTQPELAVVGAGASVSPYRHQSRCASHSTLTELGGCLKASESQLQCSSRYTLA